MSEITNLKKLKDCVDSIVDNYNRLEILIEVLSRDSEDNELVNSHLFNLVGLIDTNMDVLSVTINECEEMLEGMIDEIDGKKKEHTDTVERFFYEVSENPETGEFYTMFHHPTTHEQMIITGETEQDVIKKVDWLIDSIPPEGVTVF